MSTIYGKDTATNNSIFPKVKIWSESGLPVTHVSINGQTVKGVVGIQYDAEVDSIPRVTLELNSLDGSGIDVNNAELMLKFHPTTVHEAMTVLGITGMYEDGDLSPIYLVDDGK